MQLMNCKSVKGHIKGKDECGVCVWSLAEVNARDFRSMLICFEHLYVKMRKSQVFIAGEGRVDLSHPELFHDIQRGQRFKEKQKNYKKFKTM